jgi:hypothetical protein
VTHSRVDDVWLRAAPMITMSGQQVKSISGCVIVADAFLVADAAAAGATDAGNAADTAWRSRCCEKHRIRPQAMHSASSRLVTSPTSRRRLSIDRGTMVTPSLKKASATVSHGGAGGEGRGGGAEKDDDDDDDDAAHRDSSKGRIVQTSEVGLLRLSAPETTLRSSRACMR